MDVRQKRNEALGKRVVKALESRNMEAYYVATKEEAVKKALELIPEGSNINAGGSMSIRESGLLDAINSGNYEMYYKQQEIFHGIYLQECGNDVLIGVLSQLKNKFVSKTYALSTDSEDKEVLHTTNSEHRVILDLFYKKDSSGLLKYLQETHWNPELACTEVTE